MTRGNIQMKQEDGTSIYFYQHSDAYNLPAVLQAALKRGKNRWKDEPYLGRIIFSEMIQHSVLGETGFGISSYLTDGGALVIEVECKSQTITHEGKKYSFANFCEEFADEQLEELARERLAALLISVKEAYEQAWARALLAIYKDKTDNA